MNAILKEYQGIEKEFFDVNEENKTVTMSMEYHTPSDIFDTEAKTKIPFYNDDFGEWLTTALEYTPRGYKLNLDIAFNDLDGYTEEELISIFKKNVILNSKRRLNNNTIKNRIAIGLIGLGLAFLVSMILLMSLWKDGGIAKEIISYVFDIMTTVTLWEALTILVVENKEKREVGKSMVSRFHNISFHKK